MGAHPVRSAVVERPHLQVHRLEAAKRALDLRQVLVGTDRLRRVEPLRLDVGPDDVDAVELLLGRDLRLVKLSSVISVTKCFAIL